MNTENLDLSALTSALNRLAEGNDRYLKEINDTQIRDGLIQRYEFTYEISHKIIKRHLERSSPNPIVLTQRLFQI